MNPNSTWIEDLLKNNYPPSEEEAQGVKKLLLEPLKRLDALDSEIMNLRKHLSELENSQTETRQQIASYETILSPIRSIPPDVLREIFFHCLPTHRNPIMASSDCPLLLTRICSTWREAAMTTPKLWERLYITFTDQDTVPDLESLTNMPRNSVSIHAWRHAQSKAVKERTSALLRKRCEAVREWFLRSGTRPLSISLHFATTPWYLVPYSERRPSITMEFLSLLASLAPRWKRFEINSTMNIYRVLDNMLPISQMSLLTSLRGNYEHSGRESGPAGGPLRILDAPNLRRISISVADTRLWGLSARSLVQRNKLTHITCLRLSLPETLFLFRNSSNLVHYKGTIIHGGMEDALKEGHISLPFLRSLSINENVNSSVVTNVYDCIDAPMLQWVTYGNYFHIANYYSPDHPAPIPILPLLRRSTELRYLCIDGTNMNVWDIGTTLRAVPSVTRLVIGKEEVEFNYTLQYRDQDPFLEQSWTFSELVVGAFFNNTENDPQALLPRLTSLVISCPSLSISDDTLFELIKSRMTRTSPETAILRSVKGRFFREVQKDITTEIAHHAELVGVKVHLDLKYVQPTLNVFSISVSPQRGLKEDTAFVRLWKDQYEDAEDITSRWHFGSDDPFL